MSASITARAARSPVGVARTKARRNLIFYDSLTMVGWQYLPQSEANLNSYLMIVYEKENSDSILFIFLADAPMR
jgi:hypothetical protein